MLSALALMAAVPATVPMAPTTKWAIEYDTDMCVLSRGYQSNGKELTLAFRPYPMGTETEIVLVVPGFLAEARNRKVEVMLLPAASTTSGTYLRYSLPKTRQTLTRLTLGDDALAGIDAADTLVIRFDGREQRFGLPAIKAGMNALKICQADLLRSWGIDPAERDKVVTPPKGNPGAWFGPNVYPAAAISAREQGRAVAIVVVNADGSTRTCTIATTSGSLTLDAATCEVLRRARFLPGRDKDDKPVTAHVVVPVRWVLP